LKILAGGISSGLLYQIKCFTISFWGVVYMQSIPVVQAEPTAHDTNDASPLAHSLLASIAVSNRHFLHG
jgi:hypothetical protein